MHREGLKIRMSRVDLLEKIKEQRAKHVAQHEQAMQTWRNMMYAEADKVVKEFTGLKRFPPSLLKLSQHPQCYVSDFDVNIAMLESAKNELIELEQEDYERLVLGKFAWAATFSATNAFYGIGGERAD